jgi:hypothetical protein
VTDQISRPPNIRYRSSRHLGGPTGKSADPYCTPSGPE